MVTHVGLGAAAIATVVLWVPVFIGAHVSRWADYDYRDNAVSDFGVGKSWPYYWMCNALMAAAFAFVDAGLGVVMKPLISHGKLVTAVALFAAAAAARLLTCVFPTVVRHAKRGSTFEAQMLAVRQVDLDVGEQRQGQRTPSWQVTAHYLFAGVMFGCGCAGAAEWASATQHTPFQSAALRGMAWAMVACCAAFVLAHWVSLFHNLRRTYTGIFQRMTYLSFMVYLFTAGVVLVSH